ncbi:unnamed protein product [Didymodactylos carnosus]|uniref:Potassium channel tetramerisation-type BTB domain-containing protein n=1 Tax=Didymodactylos carnosus TaxID=1234261 RepID=A0A814ZQ97_9BILA|nr:unnamed protein product [Didymodactylos carnosus]CAF1246012.1 unnamed protein product [Didymodactylos carnosus]CAF3701666.1 unnamed protein product [Didymodactylos carnosus]CAF4011993.1 unnamed protein product [Didymodactylos carnosus]
MEIATQNSLDRSILVSVNTMREILHEEKISVSDCGSWRSVCCKCSITACTKYLYRCPLELRMKSTSGQGYATIRSKAPDELKITDFNDISKDVLSPFKLTNDSIHGINVDCLFKYPDSYLTKLVAEGGISVDGHRQNLLIIDEEPSIFESILTYYRYDKWLLLPKQFESLEKLIIEKYKLPSDLYKRKLSVVVQVPFYVIVQGIDAVGGSSSRPRKTITEPEPFHIPELRNCPYFKYYNRRMENISYSSYIEIVNYLCSNGYTIEKWDDEKHVVKMKKLEKIDDEE